MKLFIIFIFSFFLYSCTEYDSIAEPIDTPSSPVILNIEEVPYVSLSDYNFFQGELKDLDPVYGVLPYDLINSLFSDYAHKKRFVWMPTGTSAMYVNDHESLFFPEGAAVIKNFYYDDVQPTNSTKIIETRVMIRKNGSWIFANYVWNDSQTEAILDLTGSNVDITWNENGETKSTSYRIPSEQECFTCHKVEETPSLIGPKPQNLNKTYTYEDGVMNQIEKWKLFGYLNNADLPTSYETVSNWEDGTLPIKDRIRGYVDINCAHCHQDLAHCDYTPMRFAWDESSIDSFLGICVENVEPLDGFDFIVKPGNANRSVLFARIASTEENIRMPILGRTLVHEEAKNLFQQWINEMPSSECE